MPKTNRLLEVKDLNTSFKIDAGRVLAVNGVSFGLDKGKILGIVGESGSGKSVTAYSVMGILDKNGRIDSGKIIYNGIDLLKLKEKQMRSIRGNKISIIFQDAMTSLNPTWSIGNQLREAILTHSKDPIKVATEDLENAVIADKQRIESIKNKIEKNPDSQELKDDLKVTTNKLEDDTRKLRETRERTIIELKVNEKQMMHRYRKTVKDYNLIIREKRKVYLQDYFKLNNKPTEGEIFGHQHYQRHIANINTKAQALLTAKEYLQRLKDNLPLIQSREDYRRVMARYYNYIRRGMRAVRIAKSEYKKAKRALKFYRFKFNYQFVHRPRIKRRNDLKAAKLAKRNYYWECRSAYRETKYSANKKALQMLKEVGITEPEKRLKQYPFELSGGMLQRCMIAMALVEKPDILIADEPTTALDVTIQAQILELLKKLQKEYGMAIIIITHDLGVVAQICDEVDVMYAGRIVERGTVNDIFYNPQHEYTKGLLKSMPKLNQPKGLLDPIKGNPVDLFCLPKGCAFASRCKECMKICIDQYPEEVMFDRSGHCASCWAMVKRMHEANQIDVMKGKPTGKPLIYNGALIANERKKKEKKAKLPMSQTDNMEQLDSIAERSAVLALLKQQQKLKAQQAKIEKEKARQTEIARRKEEKNHEKKKSK